MYVEPSILNGAAQTITSMSSATVYLAVTEDFGRSLKKDTPTVYVAGGISSYATYGLGMYNALIISVTMDGVLSVESGREPAGSVEGAVAHANALYHTNAGVTGGSSIWGTNGCFTAID